MKYLIILLLFLFFSCYYYSPENYENQPSTSSTFDVSEGSSRKYGWGLPKTERIFRQPSRPKPVICPVCQTKYIINDFRGTCEKCDITKHPEIHRYVLKSSIPPLPDMEKYILKTQIPVCPDMSKYILKTEIPSCPDMSKYILKTEIPKCPNPFQHIRNELLPFPNEKCPDSSLLQKS